MIDIKKIRDDFENTAAQLARRGVEQETVAKARDLDARRRSLLGETESLKAKLQAVREAGCAGTAFWKLGLENSGARGLVAGGDAQLQSSPVRKDDIERGKEY